MKIVSELLCLTSGLILIVIGGILHIFTDVQTFVSITMIVVGFLLMLKSGEGVGGDSKSDNVAVSK
jgi:hypothetical protein